MAGTTGLEPATSNVTGWRSNQLNYVPGKTIIALRNGGALLPGATPAGKIGQPPELDISRPNRTTSNLIHPGFPDRVCGGL